MLRRALIVVCIVALACVSACKGDDEPGETSIDGGNEPSHSGGSGGKSGQHANAGAGGSEGQDGSGGQPTSGDPGGSGGSGGTDAGGKATTDGLIIGADPSVSTNEAIHALCKRVKDCDEPSLRALSLEQCELYLAQPCLGWSLLTEADGIATCVAAIKAWKCDDEDDNPVEHACWDGAVDRVRERLGAVDTSRGNGEPCGADALCGKDLVCDADPITGCGKCIDAAQPGDPCRQIGDVDFFACDEGFCDADKTCQSFVATGEPCTDRSECAAGHCINDKCAKTASEGEECEVDNDCRGESCVSGTCQSTSHRAALGEACLVESDCERGRCAAGTCQMSVPVGGKCALPDDCADGHCLDGKCVLLASCAEGGKGEPCTLAGCQAGLECDESTGRCVTGEARVALGGPCMGELHCTSGYCDTSTEPGKCALRPGGWDCARDDQCASGTCANEFVCTAEGDTSMCE